MEIQGKVFAIGELQQVNETFKKRDLIIEYAENPTYPEFIKFDSIQDKTDLLNKVKVGDTVDVSFNLRGKPFTDKTGKTAYFNNLSIWKLSVVSAGTQASAPTTAANPMAPGITPVDDSDETLPF